MKKYHIDKSSIHGKGIILDKDVKKDETIFIFVGKEATFDYESFPLCKQALTL